MCRDGFWLLRAGFWLFRPNMTTPTWTKRGGSPDSLAYTANQDLLLAFPGRKPPSVVTSSRFVLWGLQAMCRDVFSFSFVALTGRAVVTVSRLVSMHCYFIPDL